MPAPTAPRELAASFPEVIVVDEPVKGLVQARRAGFLRASGELIANVDADTIVTEGWLNRVLDEFRRHPGLVALSGPYIYYDVSKSTRVAVRAFYVMGYGFYVLNRFVLRAGSMLQGGNFVVRRTALEQIGGYNPLFSFYGEDTDLARRLNAVGAVKFTFRLPALSSGRRLHRGGAAADRPALFDELRLGDVQAPAVHRRLDRHPELTARRTTPAERLQETPACGGLTLERIPVCGGVNAAT